MTKHTMTKQISWTTLTTGMTAVVTVSLITERMRWADGDEIAVPCCDLSVTGEVNGKGVVGHEVERIEHPQVAGRCGKLGIPEDQMQQIEAAIAEAKATPEWQAKIAKEEQDRQECAQYAADRARVERALGL